MIDFVIILIYVCILWFCVTQCLMPCILDAQLDRSDFDRDDMSPTREIEMVEVNAVPMSPTIDSQCVHKIVLTIEDEIL